MPAKARHKANLKPSCDVDAIAIAISWPAVDTFNVTGEPGFALVELIEQLGPNDT